MVDFARESDTYYFSQFATQQEQQEILINEQRERNNAFITNATVTCVAFAIGVHIGKTLFSKR